MPRTSARNSSERIEMSGFSSPAASKMSTTPSGATAREMIWRTAWSMSWSGRGSPGARLIRAAWTAWKSASSGAPVTSGLCSAGAGSCEVTAASPAGAAGGAFRHRAVLRDVGAGHERLVARAGQHQNPQLVVVLQRVANAHDLLIHLEGHGVARLRAVEGEPGHPSLAPEQHTLTDGGTRCAGRTCHRYVPLSLQWAAHAVDLRPLSQIGQPPDLASACRRPA